MVTLKVDIEIKPILVEVHRSVQSAIPSCTFSYTTLHSLHFAKPRSFHYLFEEGMSLEQQSLGKLERRISLRTWMLNVSGKGECLSRTAVIRLR